MIQRGRPCWECWRSTASKKKVRLLVDLGNWYLANNHEALAIRSSSGDAPRYVYNHSCSKEERVASQDPKEFEFMTSLNWASRASALTKKEWEPHGNHSIPIREPQHANNGKDLSLFINHANQTTARLVRLFAYWTFAWTKQVESFNL